MLVRAKNASFAYPGGSDVLKDVDLEIAPREIVGILGPNGSGKSTLVKLIAGLLKPSRGTVETTLGKDAVVPIVAQDYRAGLLPWLSAKENIRLPLILSRVPRAQHLPLLTKLIESSGVKFDLASPPHRLSGGQAQIVMLLRALVLETPLVLFDEPYSAIDVFDLMPLVATTRSLLRERKASAVFVSHKVDALIFISDRICLLSRRPGHFYESIVIDLPPSREQKLLECKRFDAIRAHVLHKIRTAEVCHDQYERTR